MIKKIALGLTLVAGFSAQAFAEAPILEKLDLKGEYSADELQDFLSAIEDPETADYTREIMDLCFGSRAVIDCERFIRKDTKDEVIARECKAIHAPCYE